MRPVSRESVHDNGEPGGDRRWDLAIDIASELWLYGEYVVELDPLPAQRLVDVRWAALVAGRLLGARAEFRVTEVRREPDPLVRVTVRYVDANGRSLERAQEGLDALLRSVQQAQTRHGARTDQARRASPSAATWSSGASYPGK